MNDLVAGWPDRLRRELAGYASLALENISREFPAYIPAPMAAPGDFTLRPRDRRPVRASCRRCGTRPS
jgi:hypothetical protein